MQTILPRSQIRCVINDGTHSVVIVANILEQPGIALYCSSAKEDQIFITTACILQVQNFVYTDIINK